MKHTSVAILIDGSFFLKRYFTLLNPDRDHSPAQVAKTLYTFALGHVGRENYLYRVFYYDCIPYDKNIYSPILKRNIDFKKTEHYLFRTQFLEELKKKRKIALRKDINSV